MHLTSIKEHSAQLFKMNIDDAEKWKLHYQRIDFGSKHLSLGMFLPCDEQGRILNEPTFDAFMDPKVIDRQYAEYKKAKENVLFEGFKRNHNAVLTSDGEYVDIGKLKI